MSRTVFVTGATGMVGKHVVALLEQRGLPLRVGTRRPGHAAVGGHAEICWFDWDDPATWRAALNGADALYLVKPPGDDPARRIRRLLDRTQELESIVMLSEIHCESRPFGDPQRAAELVVERAVEDTTILRPNWFFQNFTEGSYYPALRDHARLDIATGGQRVSYVDTRDVAAVAVSALIEPVRRERAHVITGPEALSGVEVAMAMTRVCGHQIEQSDPSLDAIRENMEEAGASPERVDFIMNLCRDMIEGKNAIVTDAVERITGRAARSFADFAAESARLWSPTGMSR